MEKLNNRVTKNVIMIVLISGLTVGMLFTTGVIGRSDKMQGPPQMNGKMQGPPGQQNDQKGGQQSNDQQAPQQGQQTDSSDAETTGKMMPPDMNNGRPGKGGHGTGMKVLTGFEAFGIAALAAYLAMSEFNKKSFKETVPDKKKAAAFAAAVVIAGSGLTAAAVLLPCHGRAGGMPQGQFEKQSQSSVEAKGAETVDGTEETLSGSYESTGEHENVILVTNGGSLTSDGATVDKKSGDGSDTDSCDFNGVNAGILVNGDSSANIKNAEIKTSANMSNGVFCTGEKSKITISNSTVTTTGERSCRGLDATNGGTIIADNMKITTQGGSCAALATDRGEGTVTVTDSTLETNGAGSPVIYSTGDISIDKTKGTANGSQITVVEGKNSAVITDSEVTASGAGNRGDVDVCGVMLYQSMSGDADEGTASFTAEDSSLAISKDSEYYKTAPMFFVTNTSAEISLTSTKLSFGSGVLLSVKGTSEWGMSGSNGGIVKLTASDQALKGDIEADKISDVTISLEDGSEYTGAINSSNTAKAVSLKVSRDSKIKLTGDTYVTSLEDEDADYSNIDLNGYKLYVNGKAI